MTRKRWTEGHEYRLGPLAFMDATDARVKPWEGHRVYVVQPHGCPRNGTMGHVYVEDAETGAFIGLVQENSLKEV